MKANILYPRVRNLLAFASSLGATDPRERRVFRLMTGLIALAWLLNVVVG